MSLTVVAVVLKQAIIKKIGDICDRIIEHIMKVDKEREYEEIKMMEALFKISGKLSNY